MKIKNFHLRARGYFDKRKRDELNFARVGFIIDGFASGLAGQKMNAKKWFGDWFGEKQPVVNIEDKKKRSEEMMNRVRLKNKILAEKDKLIKKHGKRAENSN